MTEPYNYGNNDYNNNDNYQTQDEALSNLMNSESSYSEQDSQNSYSNNQDMNNFETVQDSSEEGVVEEVQEDEKQETPKISYEALKDEFYNAPSNATQEPKFGEKDVYKVINLITLLSHCDENSIRWIEDILKVGGNDNARLSMNIIKMDKNDFEEQADTIKVMKSVLKISQDGADSGDTFKTVIDLMNSIDKMTDSQKDGLIKLNKKFIKDSGSKIRVTSRKTSNSSEIAQDLHKVFTEDDLIPGYVESLDGIIDAIRQIIK